MKERKKYGYKYFVKVLGWYKNFDADPTFSQGLRDLPV
jgi:hypothetical protein